MEWKKKSQKVVFKIVWLEGNENDTPCMPNTWFWRHFSVSSSLGWAVASSLQQVITTRESSVKRRRSWGVSTVSGLSSSQTRCAICNLLDLSAFQEPHLSVGDDIFDGGLFFIDEGSNIHKTSGRILSRCWPSINHLSLYRKGVCYMYLCTLGILRHSFCCVD